MRRIYLIVAMTLLVAAVVAFVFSPSKSILEKYENALPASETGGERIDPILSEEIAVLKGQLSAIITGSMESKLRMLEQSIRGGTLSAADLGTIQDLKSDLNILRTYSFQAHDNTSVDSLRLRQANDARLKIEYFAQELGHLKVLFYVSIASCGFLAMAMGGLWLQSAHRFKYLPKKELARPAMLESGDSDFS